ncbi:MAG: TIR domain-containing protein [Ruminococcus sp.]|nr:TIR domain-containing protein [Ruminococcus sp.]
MPYLRNYNLFISHAWKYGDEYDRLIRLLNNANNFSYKNYSAPEERPLKNTDGSSVKTSYEIGAAIDRKIANSQIILVISGMYANNREWMEYEIDTAVHMNKPIIAIKPWGNVSMPVYIKNVANEIVGWYTDSIVLAIRRHSM